MRLVSSLEQVVAARSLDVAVSPVAWLVYAIHRLPPAQTAPGLVRQCFLDSSGRRRPEDHRKTDRRRMSLDEQPARALHAQPVSPFARFVDAVDGLSFSSAVQEVSQSLIPSSKP